MKTFRNILFGVIYTVIYCFLAIISTGGGHGNFFLIMPFVTWLPIFIALCLLGFLEDPDARIYFVVLMLIHYGVTLFLFLGMKQNIINDWNRVAGRTFIFITSGFYLFGQLILWVGFFRSARNYQELK
jgi:hypothetical protein